MLLPRLDVRRGRSPADRQSFSGLEATRDRPTPLPVAEKHGLVWVTPTPGAPAIDVDGLLGGLEDDLASYGLETYHFHETRTLRQRINWKEGSFDLVPHILVVNAVFPNTVVVLQGDHVETWQVYPLAVDETVMHASLFAPEPIAEKTARRSSLRASIVTA